MLLNKLRMRLATTALSHCTSAAVASETSLPKPFLAAALPLVSLRAFSKDAAGAGTPPPPPSPDNDQTGPSNPESKASAETAATTGQGPAQGATSSTESSASDSGSGEASNPVLEAMRAQLQEQITQLRSQSTVMEQTMEDHLPRWQRQLVDIVAAWAGNFFAKFMRERIEKEFDINEFLEGAKDAFWIVNRLIGEEDYESLRPMVSAKLLNAVKTTGEEYRAGGLVWRTEIDETAPLEAQLQRVSLWSADQVAEYDKDAAAAASENAAKAPMPAGRWLVMYVKYKASQRTLITREEDGQIVANLTDKRPALWTFAAGPLPEECPVPRLDTPYWLLTFN